MKFAYSKGAAAFVLVFCVSESIHSSSSYAMSSMEKVPCLRALPPEPQVPTETEMLLQEEIVLLPKFVSSYGWVSGQLMDPTQAKCLAREDNVRLAVSFRSCSGSDEAQIWQWKNTTYRPEARVMSVIQHHVSGLVLERIHGGRQSSPFDLTDYRVGADTQRFSLFACRPQRMN